MNVTLAPDSEQYLREQIAACKFPSADEAISEALRRMREYDMKMDELRRDIAVGIEQADQGLAVEFTEATLERVKPPRQPGTLKGTVLYMAPDFDAPLEDFKEYMP